MIRNLLMEADGGAGAGSGTQGTEGQQSGQQTQTVQFDYEKLAQIVAGKQTVTEESVLKGYFKQQGLSKEQMDQAIKAFKDQQAANTPDVRAMQTQLTEAQATARKATIESTATMAAVSLGIDAKTIPYVLKMADFSQVMDQDGKVNDETMKAALNKVLEDIPALKPQTTPGTGFVQVGASGKEGQQTTQQEQLASIFGNKK